MTKQYSVTRMIDAPRDRVWELLTDASSYRVNAPTCSKTTTAAQSSR